MIKERFIQKPWRHSSKNTVELVEKTNSYCVFDILFELLVPYLKINILKIKLTCLVMYALPHTIKFPDKKQDFVFVNRM